jgi:hypothetical protein
LAFLTVTQIQIISETDVPRQSAKGFFADRRGSYPRHLALGKRREAFVKVSARYEGKHRISEKFESFVTAPDVVLLLFASLEYEEWVTASSRRLTSVNL